MKKTKKRGRPALPCHKVKKRYSIRLSDHQKEIIYSDLDKSIGLQGAIDQMIYNYGVFVSQDV